MLVVASGYSEAMSDQTEHPEPTPGTTGGLPGPNADPRNAELSDDERGDTVAMGDVAPADGASHERSP